MCMGKIADITKGGNKVYLSAFLLQFSAGIFKRAMSQHVYLLVGPLNVQNILERESRGE